MPTTEEWLEKFYTRFGQRGGDGPVGNVGIHRTVAPICRALMEVDLFTYFDQWDQRADGRNLYEITQALVRAGQWEGAWALAQLHYAQLLQYEAKSNRRLHKGHPLCNLALIGQAIRSPALIRHYALLSSAGDIYWQHKNPDLQYGGLASTILERFESQSQHDERRERTFRQLLRHGNDTPVYLEALLALRWFTEAYEKPILDLAKIENTAGKPFVEVLLDSVVKQKNPQGIRDPATGARFEAAVGLLLSATPGFEVDARRLTNDEQIDLVVSYAPDQLACIGLEQGYGLVECKSSQEPVEAKELRDFGAKCLFHRVKFGILIARAGITGRRHRAKKEQNAELVRRRFQVDGLTLLVLDITRLRDKSRNLRGIQDELAADYKRLVFGPVA